MKNLNVHILPTKEASHVIRYRSVLQFTDTPLVKSNPQHIYLTSDEEIKDGDWYFDTKENQMYRCNSFDEVSTVIFEEFEKIVGTTDPKLVYTKFEMPSGKIVSAIHEISKEDLPKIIENWNRGVKSVECGFDMVEGASFNTKDGWDKSPLKYKFNKDGSINLLWPAVSEKLYTKEEVAEFINEFSNILEYDDLSSKGGVYVDITNKWIKENLK